MIVSPVVRVAVLIAAWLSWWLAFAASWKRHREKAVKVDPGARWGMLLQSAGFFFVFVHSPRTWNSGFEMWRALAGVLFAGPAIFMLWSAVRNLGRQWRFDAGLNLDHELVQSGAYRIVRHPIYASMLGMLLASICWVGTLPGWPIGLILFLIGMEIRVRREDALLLERFGDRFARWQRSVPAYLPFIR
jgi:protein-S-isoprenylcysteine O-methyltransferase Ste14